MKLDTLQKAVEAAGFAAVPADDFEDAAVIAATSRPDEPAPRAQGTALVIASSAPVPSLSTYATQLLAQVPTGFTRRFGWGAPA